MIDTAVSSNSGQDNAAPELEACSKRSFLRLPVQIDTARLLEEYRGIPEQAWGVSHWDVHCSIDVLLLRGGTKGDAEDFTTSEVADAPVLAQLPYIASLLAPEGPFGGAIYAFIFRTKPGGITRVHTDNDQAWWRTVRIHVPIITNEGAFLLAEGRAKHLEVGEVWTFDNQERHSVVNGDRQRVHMIFDVNPNPKLAALMQRAVFDPGRPDQERWALTGGITAAGRVPPMVPVSGEPLTIREKTALGLDPEGFATRIGFIRSWGNVKTALKAFLTRCPLKGGDIVVSVNRTGASALSRTALDHIALQHAPGETVMLEVLRGARRIELPMRLRPRDHLSPRKPAARLMRRFRAAPSA